MSGTKAFNVVRTVKRSDGRIWVTYNTPQRWQNEYMPQAHFVWLTHFPDADLKWPNVIHHINGVIDDDRIENLELISHASHMTKHQMGAKRTAEARAKISKKMKQSWVDKRESRLSQLNDARSKSEKDPINGRFKCQAS